MSRQVKIGLRKSDPHKWRDPWFRRLSGEGKMLVMWLWDNCDWAGFVDDFDTELISEDLDMEESELTEALEEVTAPYKGIRKVVSRWLEGCEEGVEGGYEGVHVWCASFIKFQQGGFELNPNNNAHIHIIRLLQDRSKAWTEIESFYPGALKLLRRSRQGASKPRSKSNCNGNVTVTVGEEGSVRGEEDFEVYLDVEKWESGKSDVDYDLIGTKYKTFGIRFEDWLNLKRMFPCADAGRCVKQTHEAIECGKVKKSAYGFLKSKFSESDVRKENEYGEERCD